MHKPPAYEPLKILQSRIYGLGDALLAISSRIDSMLERNVDWSPEYLRYILAETATACRRAVQEDKDYE